MQTAYRRTTRVQVKSVAWLDIRHEDWFLRFLTNKLTLFRGVHSTGQRSAEAVCFQENSRRWKSCIF